MPDAHHEPEAAATVRTEPPAQPAPEPAPRRLCDVRATATLRPAPAGALWKLTEPGRQLDANVVHVPPRRRIETHTEPGLDVLLLVIAGRGNLSSADRTEQLTDGVLFWLPHGSTRRITAGAEGLSYLTVHRRRPGMQIRSGPGPDQAGAASA